MRKKVEWKELLHDLNQNVDKYIKHNEDKELVIKFIDLEISTNKQTIHSAIYEKAVENFQRLKKYIDNTKYKVSERIKTLTWVNKPSNPLTLINAKYHYDYISPLPYTNKFSKKFRNIIKMHENLTKKVEFINCKINTIQFLGEQGFNTFLYRCDIGEVSLTSTYGYEKDINQEIKIYGGKVGALKLHNYKFSERVSISNVQIYEVYIFSCNFNKKFDFKFNVITKINSIHDSNFNEHADFHGTEFNKAHKQAIFSKVTFENMAIFEYCVFDKLCEFKYVTFESFANFRNAIFKDGLVLDSTNWKQTPNFLEVKINIESANNTRETYRIIKSAFEKNHNRVDANEYHSLELQERRKELDKEINLSFKDIKILPNRKKLGFLRDWIIFNIQEATSNHSTNWMLPIYWIVMVGLIFTIFSKSGTSVIQVVAMITIGMGILFTLTKNTYARYLLPLVAVAIYYYMLPESNIETLFNSMNPLKLKETEHPILFYFNKIIIGYLVYQFILAVRKDTRK